MKTRAITGIVFVIVLVGSFLLGPWVFSLFFALIALLSLNEFYGIVDSNSEKISINRVVGIAAGAGLFGGAILFQMHVITSSVLLALIPLITLLFWTELFRKTGNPFGNIAFTFLGIIYAVVPFVFFYLLGFIDGSYDYQYPLGFLILLWASDTGAYLAGRSLGKTKLFERHSPKKTWEGSFGGLLISLLAAFILSRYFVGLETWEWMITSVIIVVFGTYGDLTESMLKRSYGIKDSGNILPGHGGFLDRFDGLLLSAPLVYLFLMWVV